MTDPVAPVDPRLIEAPSALQNLLGYRLTSWSEGFAVIEQALEPKLMNRQGIPHGGVHATLLDTTMGYAGCYTGDPEKRQLALTLSMSVNFIGRATGTRLIATARVSGGGRSIFFAEGRLTDDTGTLVATSTGTFRLRR